MRCEREKWERKTEVTAFVSGVALVGEKVPGPGPHDYLLYRKAVYHSVSADWSSGRQHFSTLFIEMKAPTAKDTLPY